MPGCFLQTEWHKKTNTVWLLDAFLGNMVKILVLVLEIEDDRRGCVAPPLVPARRLHARVKHGRCSSFTHRHYITLKCGSGSRLLAHNADPDQVFSVSKIIVRKIRIIHRYAFFLFSCVFLHKGLTDAKTTTIQRNNQKNSYFF
jgi:hypothetical protein